MEAPLHEAFNQAKFSATLSLHLRQAYDKFIANCTIAHNGGIFIASPAAILWICQTVAEGHFIVLDSKNKPISIDPKFGDTLRLAYATALHAYHEEYTALVKARKIERIVKSVPYDGVANKDQFEAEAAHAAQAGQVDKQP